MTSPDLDCELNSCFYHQGSLGMCRHTRLSSTTRELKDTSQPLPSCSRLQSFRSDAHHKIYSNSPWTHKSSIKNQMFFLCSIYKSINVWVDHVSCLTLISGFWRVRGPGHPAGSCPEWGGRCCRWISAPIPELSSAADGSVEDTLPPQWTWSTIKALANNYTNNISVPQTAPKQLKDNMSSSAPAWDYVGYRTFLLIAFWNNCNFNDFLSNEMIE